MRIEKNYGSKWRMDSGSCQNESNLKVPKYSIFNTGQGRSTKAVEAKESSSPDESN